MEIISAKEFNKREEEKLNSKKFNLKKFNVDQYYRNLNNLEEYLESSLSYVKRLKEQVCPTKKLKKPIPIKRKLERMIPDGIDIPDGTKLDSDLIAVGNDGKVDGGLFYLKKEDVTFLWPIGQSLESRWSVMVIYVKATKVGHKFTVISDLPLYEYFWHNQPDDDNEWTIGDAIHLPTSIMFHLSRNPAK